MKEILQQTEKLARDLGAECDIILSKSDSFSTSAQQGAIDKYSLNNSQIMGIRVIKDGKVGISYSETLAADDLEKMVEQAITNSKFNDANEYELISGKEGNTIVESADPEDEHSIQDKIDLTLELEKQVYAKEKSVKAVPYNGFSENSSELFFYNSKGKYCYNREKMFSCYTSALISDGTENSMNYHGVQGRSFSELDVDICVKESVEHAKNWLGAGPIKTGSYDVVFTLDELQSVFSCFLGMFSAKGAWDNINPFADKLGAQIGNKQLTINDLPRYSDAFYQYHFDSEGMDVEDLHLIENGVLKNFYHNSATARYFNTDNTARASRGAKGGLGVSGTNLVISKGDEANPLSGEYVELHSLQGLHSGASFVSGDFSFGASGYHCREGKRIAPVKGITVAGNFYKLLNNISAIGDSVKANSSKSFFSPVIRFANMRIAGS